MNRGQWEGTTDTTVTHLAHMEEKRIWPPCAHKNCDYIIFQGRMRSMTSNVPRHFQQQCQFILGFFWTISSLPTRLLYDFSYFIFHSSHSSSKLGSSSGAAEATPKHKIVRNIAGVMSLRPGVGKQMNMWAHQHFLKVFLLLPKKLIYLWSIIFFDPFFRIIFERLLKVLRVMYEIN